MESAFSCLTRRIPAHLPTQSRILDQRTAALRRTSLKVEHGVIPNVLDGTQLTGVKLLSLVV